MPGRQTPAALSKNKANRKNCPDSELVPRFIVDPTHTQNVLPSPPLSPSLSLPSIQTTLIDGSSPGPPLLFTFSNSFPYPMYTMRIKKVIAIHSLRLSDFNGIKIKDF